MRARAWWLIAQALAALVGPEAQGLSAIAVSRLQQVWREEYRAWQQRRVDDEQWVSIWVDGIDSGLRAEDHRLCALVVIGVNARREKHFLAIEDEIREFTHGWCEVLVGLQARGLTTPHLAMRDATMGFWAALEELFPTTRPQRC